MATNEPAGSGRRLRLSIGAFLTLTLGGLTAIPLLLVLAITLFTAYTSTSDLLRGQARLLAAQLADSTEAHLAAAEAAPRFIAEQIAARKLDITSAEALRAALPYALAAAPQLGAVSFVDPRGSYVAAIHTAEGAVIEQEEWANDRVLAQVAERSLLAAAPYWGEPVYLERAGVTVLPYVWPLRDGDGPAKGSIVATISLNELSRFVAGVASSNGDTSFILYGTERVVAHPRLVDGKVPLSTEQPLPPVDGIGDPVLAELWNPDTRWGQVSDSVRGGAVEAGGRAYIVLLETLQLDGASTPWVIGSYVPRDDVATEMRRLFGAGVASLLALAVAIGLAIWLGRGLRRPIAELQQAAAAISSLSVDQLHVAGRSRLIELDDALRTFGRAGEALRMFARYVPRNVVRLLMERGEDGLKRTWRREATIMFTDVVGFTRVAERLDSEATVALLNEHLGMLTACVEAHDGVVDKFIGDAVMAVWAATGAGMTAKETAEKAVAAAQAMREAMRASNLHAPVPLRLRIGLHTGEVIVGNIGAPTRLNFTVVGDAVNIAQRVEGAGKQLCAGAEVAVMMTEATAELLDPSVPLRDLGPQVLQGRSTPIRLLVLEDPGHRPASEEVLAFWLSDWARPRWFEKDPDFDAEIAARFAPLVERARAGELDDWLASPRDALALLVLLDQFPRNIHRGKPEAFACDVKARAVATTAMARGHDTGVDEELRKFFYLPLEHSEALADQERSVAMFRALGDPEGLDYAIRHRDVIARFGRFPHRNAALGRSSTAEEIEFLRQPGSSF